MTRQSSNLGAARWLRKWVALGGHLQMLFSREGAFSGVVPQLPWAVFVVPDLLPTRAAMLQHLDDWCPASLFRFSVRCWDAGVRDFGAPLLNDGIGLDVWRRQENDE